MAAPGVLFRLLPGRASADLGPGDLGPPAGLGSPGSRRRGWGPPGGSAGGTGSRMEFSRFGFTGRLDPGMHLARLGRNARLNLPRLGAGTPGWTCPGPVGRPGWTCPGPGWVAFPGSTRRWRRQLLDLLRHLGGQGHGGLGGQRRDPARPRPGGTAPGWTRGIVAVTLGTFRGAGTRLGLFRLAWAILKFCTAVGRRQAVPLDQGRRDNLLEITMAVDHPTGRHHTVNPGDVGGVPD